MNYNFNDMLLDFSKGEKFFFDFSYRNLIAYNEPLAPIDLTKSQRSSDYGYEVHDWGGTGKNITVDPLTEYLPNSLGYRSPEFTQADVLFAGCSHTYGVGVPEEAIWGVQVSKSLGLSYMNLAGSGQSVYFAVQNIFAFIKKYGPPKIVMMVLPSLSRMLTPVSVPLARALNRQSRSRLPGREILTASSGSGWSQTEDLDTDIRPKHQKIPYVLENVLYPELSYYLNLQHLNALQLFCASTGIELLWGSLSEENSDLFASLKLQRAEYFGGYVKLDPFLAGDTKTLNHCNQHDKLKEKYDYCFNLGGDKEWEWDGTAREEHGHAGVHHHTHWAETFLKNLDF
jgi:hypothetical protein